MSFLPRQHSTEQAVRHALFGLVPAVVTGWLLLHVFSTGFAAIDFRQDFWVAGWRVLHGQDLYSWTRSQIAAGVSFPYPALAGLLFAPFALLSPTAAEILFTIGCLLAVAGTLRLMSLRDWRLYGIVLLWSPVVIGWQTANLSLLLACGLAATWRYRDNPRAAGILLALLISVKPITLPLVVWLLATRRFRAGAYGLATAVLVNGISWIVVGFSAIGHWLHLLATQGDVLYRKGYGVIAFCAELGASRQEGLLVGLVLCAGLALVCLWLGRRGAEAAVFSLSVVMMLTFAPQVDSHYFALLIVPLLIAHPRLHWTWLVPLALWLCPAAEASLWQVIVWWLTAAALTAEMLAQGLHVGLRAPHWRAERPGTALAR